MNLKTVLSCGILVGAYFSGTMDAEAVRAAYIGGGRADTYAQALQGNPALDGQLTARYNAIQAAINANPDGFLPEGYKRLEFIYEITRPGANADYRIDTGDANLMANHGRLRNCLVKVQRALGNEKSRSRGSQRESMVNHLAATVDIEMNVTEALRTCRERYVGIDAQGSDEVTKKS